MCWQSRGPIQGAGTSLMSRPVQLGVGSHIAGRHEGLHEQAPVGLDADDHLGGIVGMPAEQSVNSSGSPRCIGGISATRA